LEGGLLEDRGIVMGALAGRDRGLRECRRAPIVGVTIGISDPGAAMTQTTNRFYDEFARLMNDAAGVASGVRREVETVFRSQAERILRDLDLVKREEFEAVKEMARLAREENETLKARVAALEARLGSGGAA
jgi:BMFP domain-containing protein YqiC